MNDWRMTLMKHVAPILYIPRNPLTLQGGADVVFLRIVLEETSSLIVLVNSSSCLRFRAVYSVNIGIVQTAEPIYSLEKVPVPYFCTRSDSSVGSQTKSSHMPQNRLPLWDSTSNN